LPHISYDLDGDGFVGGRDYVISKYHDKDGDGKLNAEERKAAEEAVKNVRNRLNCLGIRRQILLERGVGWSKKTFPYFAEAWSLC
jgi:hypothetical protein